MKKTLIFIIIILIIIFYLYYEDNFLSVSRYLIKKNELSESFNHYKIIHISDYHNNKSNFLKKTIIKKVEKEKPNMIVITGDLVDCNRTSINTSLSLVKELINIAPIYYVVGNHEASMHGFDYLKDELKKIGVNVLENENVVIKENKDSINIVGVLDPAFAKKKKLNEEIVKEEIESINYDKSNFTILLSHRPELFNAYTEKRVDLVFCGHAHGGQVRLPFIGGLFAPAQGYFPKYTKGVFSKDWTTMVISRGLGNSKFPFRINNRPELVVVELNRE